MTVERSQVGWDFWFSRVLASGAGLTEEVRIGNCHLLSRAY